MEPSAAQREAMARMAGARRFVWNWALAQSRAHFAETGKGLSAAELSRRFTALKQRPETAWLQDVDSQAMQQSLADLQTRLSEFLREAGALSAVQKPQGERQKPGGQVCKALEIKPYFERFSCIQSRRGRQHPIFLDVPQLALLIPAMKSIV